jgi:death on curing protein
MIAYLSREEIIYLNKIMIDIFGGVYFLGGDNIRNNNSFEFIINASNQVVFGKEIYDTIFTKGAAYLFYIIKDHIFNDGNKRTGVMSVFLFLRKNNIRIKEQVNSPRVVRYAERIASCKPNINHISRWLKRISEI